VAGAGCWEIDAEPQSNKLTNTQTGNERSWTIVVFLNPFFREKPQIAGLIHFNPTDSIQCGNHHCSLRRERSSLLPATAQMEGEERLRLKHSHTK
jgi:hypothetical protein